MNIKKKFRDIILRNQFDLMGEKIENKHFNLEWWQGETNLGDSLSPVIFSWMLDRHHLSDKSDCLRKVHLLSTGSLIGAARFDAVIWGSGIMNAFNLCNLIKHRKYVKYDIRAVRGPISRDFLLQAGYICPEIYGDPAIIMPLIYKPKSLEKIYDVTVIKHHLSKDTDKNCKDINYLDIRTTNYKEFIDTILKSELIISSSLHGIILAETYGVPAVFLNTGVNDQFIKYMDWYYSTGRTNVKMAKSISEAKEIKPMEIPDLGSMRQDLINAFPYDLWEKVYE